MQIGKKITFRYSPHQNLYKLLEEVGFDVADHWTYLNFVFFFLRFESNTGVESAFICKKL
jgi:hypothetical protein